MSATKRNLAGKKLNELWGVGAKHALYSETGNWYHQLKEFPGALFDANGYILFNSSDEYFGCESLRITKDLNIPSGISSISGYVRVTDNSKLQVFSQQLKNVAEQQSQYQYQVDDFPDESSESVRVLTEVCRIIRDTKIAQKVKLLHRHKCQICGEGVDLGNGKSYVEAHHIKPLGGEHNGPDVVENILCVCPNHHAQLDFGAIRINVSSLRTALGHEIGDKYVQYHNLSIFRNAG